MSSFATHNLTNEEALNGQVLSPLQLQVLQNEIAQIAEQILALTFDPSNPIRFAQDDAHLKGQLQFAQFLQARSEEARQVLLQLAQAAQQSGG